MKIGSKLQLSPIYQIVSEENSKLYETVYELINVFVTQQFRSFRWLVFPLLLLASKKVKIAQIAQINQLFHLLNLICAYGDAFYGLTHMLMSKKCKQ